MRVTGRVLRWIGMRLVLERKQRFLFGFSERKEIDFHNKCTKHSAVVTHLAWASFQTDRLTKKIYTVETFEGKLYIHISQGVVLAVAVLIAKTP